MKALVARALAKRVRDGEVIGLGSGSTAELAVEQIGQRIAREGVQIFGIPTSYRTAVFAAEAGIRVLAAEASPRPAWAFDGADEVDPAFNMVKGRGAAMLSEKIMAKRAEHMVIIVSEDKLVQTLGSVHPVPIEVIPEAVSYVREQLKPLGARECTLRAAAHKYGPVMTEHNNVILDTVFERLTPELDAPINAITGVVEHGLFVNCNQELLVAKSDGVWSQRLIDGEIKEELVEKP